MKINYTSLISVVSVLACCSAAKADMIADFYIGAMGGAGGQTLFADHDNKTDTSTVFGAIAGVDLPIFRIEGEYDYFNSKNLNTNAAMVNLYAKMPSTVILPYIGAGFGTIFGGEQTFDNTPAKYDIETTAAYQGMIGATIDMMVLPLKFDIEGRVLYAPDIYNVSHTSPDMLQYNARVKVRYIF